MEWASLSAFCIRGVQGIWEFPLERNHSDNSYPCFDHPASTSLQPELPFQSGVNRPHLANDLGDLCFQHGEKNYPFKPEMRLK